MINFIHLKSFILFLILICSILSPPTAGANCIGDPKANTSVQSVYVVPQLPTTQIYSKWAPFLERIGRATHQCFDLVIPATIPAFEAALDKGQPDFAFMNPYHQVLTHKKNSYIPLVSSGETYLDGLIFVKKDSDITQVEQLAGKKVAFPAPNAFGSTLLIQAYLASKNIVINPTYVSTHSNVYRAVILGDVAAGGGINLTFEMESTDIKNRLRILYQSPKFTPHPFSASTRVSQEDRDKVVQAIMRLSDNPSGRALLEGVQMQNVKHVNYAIDYQPIENLGLDRIAKNQSE